MQNIKKMAEMFWKEQQTEELVDLSRRAFISKCLHENQLSYHNNDEELFARQQISFQNFDKAMNNFLRAEVESAIRYGMKYHSGAIFVIDGDTDDSDFYDMKREKKD